MSKRAAIGADHAGFLLKEVLKAELKTAGYTVTDVGTDSTASCDYPDFGYTVAEEVASGRAKIGVVVCGSGIGISIAANRNPKVRAALCHTAELATLARQHNDANVLALGARVVNEETAKQCLSAFLATEFEGGRHGKRVEKLGKEVAGCQ